MQSQKELVELLNNELAIEMPEKISFEELRENLSQHINYLIQTNFQKLVSILYRIDVSEIKLKALLQENKFADAGAIIADLIIERQLQKIKSRQQFSQRDKNLNNEEQW
ncbi:MAG: hypothetical protein JJE22_05325 [Bacteroidia bacterium]|nr:hypothetical protein [Bacteroidia bacterium]